MRSRKNRWIAGAVGVLAAGMLYQTACMSFGGNQLLRTVDFCFLFDCQNGAFGGLFDWCPDQTDTTSSGTDAVQSTNLFVDCPVTTTQ